MAQVTGKTGPLNKGDIRLIRSTRGIVTFEVNGIVVGEVFARDHYLYEFYPRTDWEHRIPAFSAPTVREMKAIIEEVVR